MSASSYDVIVIGAGIVGAACALECAREGLRVLVIEAGIVGGGATAAGMGHLVVMDDSEAQFALTRYSRGLWLDLADSLTDECEFVKTGTIWVAADDLEMTEVRRKHEFYLGRGVRAEILDAATLSTIEPNLRDDLKGGLLVPDDAVIYPPSAAEFLLNQARRVGKGIGFELLTGRRVKRFEAAGVVMEDGSQMSAGAIVNCTGHLSPELVPGLNVQPRKGHLLITDRYPGFANHQLIELGYLKSAHSLTADSVAFNIQPRRTGQLLIGSSRQYGATSSDIEPQLLRKMLARACEYMPGLAELSSIRTWTGFRAATPDKLPLIGPVTGSARFYLATGHEGLGITTSLGSARLLVDQLLNRSPSIPVEPYLPARFKDYCVVPLHA
jgi:glycine/D-amino acid oxidase-like deaminating enzyme